jgi:hypothetical protein
MIFLSLLAAVVVMMELAGTTTGTAVASVSLVGHQNNHSRLTERQKLDKRFLEELPDNNGSSYPLGTEVWWEFDGEWCVMNRRCNHLLYILSLFLLYEIHLGLKTHFMHILFLFIIPILPLP